MRKNFRIILGISLLLMISCAKDPKEPEKPNSNAIYTNGLFVINEGLFNMNNSTITFYNFADSTAETDFFENNTGRKLGDTGNDIEIYGSKLYAVVNVSSQVEVVDASTGKSLRQIPLFADGKQREPRKIAFWKNKALVSCFDGNVVVIDTTTLQEENTIKVGRNPEGLVVVGDKLYVANSGGLSYPNYDKTVSVVDLNTFSEIKKIDVDINPCVLKADKYGDIYLITRGNYGDVKSKLQVISTLTDEVTYTFPELQISNMAIHNDIAYAYFWNDKTGSNEIITLNVKNESIISKEFITDGTKLTTPYGIAVNEATNDVFITDANKFTSIGKVYCFDSNGKQKFNFQAGLNPGSMTFIKK